MSKTLADIRKIKLEAEAKLNDIIPKLIDELEEETGLNVEVINLEFYQAMSIGEEKPESEFMGSSIDLGRI